VGGGWKTKHKRQSRVTGRFSRAGDRGSTTRQALNNGKKCLPHGRRVNCGKKSPGTVRRGRVASRSTRGMTWCLVNPPRKHRYNKERLIKIPRGKLPGEKEKERSRPTQGLGNSKSAVNVQWEKGNRKTSVCTRIKLGSTGVQKHKRQKQGEKKIRQFRTGNNSLAPGLSS